MKRALLAFCLLLPLAAGCFRLERDYPERELFALEALRPGSPSSSPLFGLLRMEALSVASPFTGRSFVYRTGDLRYAEDYYSRFVARPGEIIGGETARWLEASGLFRGVYGGPAPVEPDLLLGGEVSALYGDFRSRPARAVLEIAFTAAGGGSEGERVVLRRTYRREVPLKGSAPADLAAGWSEALGEILAALEADLGKAAPAGR